MTTREVIQGELGLHRLIARRDLARLRYWVKLVKLDNNRLVKKVYRARREEFNKGEKKDENNWCYGTWKILSELGLEQIWESENFGSDQKLKDAISEREEKIWLEKVNTRRKLRTYKTLKNKLRLENFLHELSRDEYRQFVMLRGGTNYLRIERGRWESKNVSERTCQVCISEKGEIEDEMHFMVICPMYKRESENV
jgi:hypothetical protein